MGVVASFLVPRASSKEEQKNKKGIRYRRPRRSVMGATTPPGVRAPGFLLRKRRKQKEKERERERTQLEMTLGRTLTLELYQGVSA